jgi:raffinose/stachyose/melibiose transport system permease protein
MNDLKNSAFSIKKIRNVFTPYLFVLPAFLIYGTLVFYPILYSMVLSLYKWDGISAIKEFVGIQNYVYILTKDPVFYLALVNNLKWTIASIIIPVTLGLFFALIFNSNKKGFSVFRGAIYFPATLSLVMIGNIWVWVYDPNLGLISNLTSKITSGSVDFNWLSNPSHALYYVVIAASWGYAGTCMLMFMAGLQSIPTEIFESAKIDGVNRLQKLVYITLPLIKNTMNVVLVTTFVGAFKVFDIIFVMTNGGPGRATNVLASWSYAQVFTYHDMGRGSAIAWVLALIVFITSIISNRISSKDQ